MVPQTPRSPRTPDQPTKNNKCPDAPKRPTYKLSAFTTSIKKPKNKRLLAKLAMRNINAHFDIDVKKEIVLLLDMVPESPPNIVDKRKFSDIYEEHHYLEPINSPNWNKCKV